MSGPRWHYPEVSAWLSRVLDEVGLNDVTVRRRRQAALLRENMDIVSFALQGVNITVYNFGSQSEGTTTRGLHSDADTLICNGRAHVIQKWEDWEAGKDNYLMLQEDTAPGYCRLQALRSDVPLPEEILPNDKHEYDSRGRVLLANAVIRPREISFEAEKNGPAITESVKGYMEVDWLPGFRCRAVVKIPDRWKSRQRQRNWPSRRLIKIIRKQPNFVVPVGHKLSATPHLEWRISSSLAERELVFDWTITQIRTYVVLKMVVKSFVTPATGKSITSYHCKNVVMHCMETTDQQFWQEGNLVSCIIECLTLLLSWVSNMYCPQFLNPDVNLFDGKVAEQNQQPLQSVLAGLVDSQGRFLLEIPIDGLGPRLQLLALTAGLVSLPVVGWNPTAAVTAEAESDLHRMKGDYFTLYVKDHATNDIDTLTISVHYQIDSMCKVKGKVNTSRCLAMQMWVQFLSAWLGSLLSAMYISKKQKIPQHVLLWFRCGSQSDMSTRLKLASVLHCSGEFVRAEALLLDVEERMKQNNALVCCGCYDNRPDITPEFCTKMLEEEEQATRDRFIAHCVRFSPQEKPCAPPALRHEMFRAVGDDIQHRDKRDSRWMSLGVSDSPPFLFYLQYLNYGKLEKRDLQRKSLDNLEQCVRHNDALRHLETAWNLLGQCWELEGNPRRAMECYMTSLEVRPRNNAANWHVQNLRYTMINEGIDIPQ